MSQLALPPPECTGHSESLCVLKDACVRETSAGAGLTPQLPVTAILSPCHRASTQSPHASLALSRSVMPVGLAGTTSSKQKEKELQFTGPLPFAIISTCCFSCVIAGPCYHPGHSWQDSCPNREGRMNSNAANILCQ